jgi:DNA polymerase III subunit delta
VPDSAVSADARSSGPGSGAAPPGVVLLLGDAEFLVSRAIDEVSARVLAADPLADVRVRVGSELDLATMYDLLSPSLFGGRRMLVVSEAQDVKGPAADALSVFLASPTDDVTVVIAHAGGSKGRAIVDTARAGGAELIVCARLTRAEERLDFVRREARRVGGTITPDAAAALVEAVGSDLRELAAVTAQLVGDTGGRIEVAQVAAYHRGRAEVTGFSVSDRAVVGDVPGALENLRWALAAGVPQVVIADALADGARSLARVRAASHGRANPYELAQRLGMPSWKVKRVQGQTRGWTEPGIGEAMVVVAQLNADVKGAAVDPGYALERAVIALGKARSVR